MGAAALRAWGTSLAAAMNQIAASRHACSAAQDAGLHVIHTRAAGHRVARAVGAAVGETEFRASALRQSILLAKALARLDAGRRTELLRRRYACTRQRVGAAHVIRHACLVDGSFRAKARHIHALPPKGVGGRASPDGPPEVALARLREGASARVGACLRAGTAGRLVATRTAFIRVAFYRVLELTRPVDAELGAGSRKAKVIGVAETTGTRPCRKDDRRSTRACKCGRNAVARVSSVNRNVCGEAG